MIRKFTKKAAIYTAAVMLGISIPVSSFTGVNTVITAEAATAKPKISNKTRSVYVGETTKVSLKNVSKNVKWKTSNKKVAAIKVNGTEVTITGKKAGKAVVSATYNKKNYKCTVTVKDKPASISEKKKTLEVGDSFELTLKNGGSSAKWSTSKKSVASIKKVSNTKYKITAKKKGTTNINVKYKGKTYTCKVTVKRAAEEQAYLSYTTLYVNKGNSADLELLNCKRTRYGDVKWSISDKTVASIDPWTMNDKAGCYITAKKNGTATVKAEYDGETYTCKLTVKKIDAKIVSENNNYKLRFGETITLKASGLYGNVSWHDLENVPDYRKCVIVKGNGNSCEVSCGPEFLGYLNRKETATIVATGSNGGSCRISLELIPMDISNNATLTKLKGSHITVKVGETIKVDLNGMEKYLTSVSYDGIINEFLSVKDDLLITGMKEGTSEARYYIGGNLIRFYIDVVK